MGTVALVLGIASILGTLVGAWSNHQNNKFIDETNQENREFQEQTNLQNHQWSQEAAQWEYEHEKPQRQYADLLAAGITPAAAAQKITGANVSYSPATAVAPQNMPKSTNMLNDSLQGVFSDIGNYSSMAQAQASAEKTIAETKVISEAAIKRANAEIDQILADTLKSYSDIAVNDSNIAVNNAQIDSTIANTELTNEKINTEHVNRKSIELSNQEKEIQLEFTRKTLEMSLHKTEAEIKVLSEQTAKLQEEINGLEFETKFKEWRDVYIQTYGVAPEQGWQDLLFKAMSDGKGDVLLNSLSKSLHLIFSSEDNPYKYVNEQWLKDKDANGEVYHEYYFGNRRLPNLERWHNGFFRE